jgi:hypothetical protein
VKLSVVVFFRPSKHIHVFMVRHRQPPYKSSTKNGVLWVATPCGSCKNRVSEELSASISTVTRIGELGMLAVTSNRRMLRRNTKSVASYGQRCSQFTDSCHPDAGRSSQKTLFFIVTAVKTSNPLQFIVHCLRKTQQHTSEEYSVLQTNSVKSI